MCTCCNRDTETTVKGGHTTTRGHKTRLWVFWRIREPQTAPVTVALLFSRPRVSSGQPEWQSANSVVHKHDGP